MIYYILYLDILIISMVCPTARLFGCVLQPDCLGVSYRPLLVLTVWVCFSEFLQEPLEKYVKTLSVPVYIERMGTRTGLIRARLKGELGARGGQRLGWLKAAGDVLQLGWTPYPCFFIDNPLIARSTPCTFSYVIWPFIDDFLKDNLENVTMTNEQ